MPDHAIQRGAEQAELQAVLASGIFSRAPSLALMLAYICRKHFEGEADSIKEYNIAVEALGRPTDFDQKKDSIVRVEAHRLRKRLRQYYDGDGASHDVQIELPLGGYAPTFTHRAGGISTQLERLRHDDSHPVNARRFPTPVIAFGVLLIGVLIALGSWRLRTASPDIPDPVRDTAVPNADTTPVAAIAEVRILCGSSIGYTDSEGHPWVPDRYYQGGTALGGAVVEVSGTLDPALFSHWREGTFSYRIPVNPGIYEVTLYFAEPKFGLRAQASGDETLRLFDVLINGTARLIEMDLVAEAGRGRTMVTRVFRDIAPNADGLIVIEFTNRVAGAVVNAITVMPGSPGRIRPIRIAARKTPYTDLQGRVWSSDRAFAGGKLVKRVEGIAGTADSELYRGERYGNFAYTFSVPPDSTYSATLYFAETWFGGGGQGGDGSRLFDVFCNGEKLIHNFDVHHAAGGPFRAIQRTFKGLRPTPNGKLRFQFNPSRNYAFVNAIEILDDGTVPQTPAR